MQGLNSYGSDSDEEPSTSKLPLAPTPSIAAFSAQTAQLVNSNSISIKSSILPSSNSNLSPKRAGKRRESSTSPPPFITVSQISSSGRSDEAVVQNKIDGSHKNGAGSESALEMGIQFNSLSEFGIPAIPTGESDPAVQAKLTNFYNLSISRGLHFNDSLSASKAFRNPRIYTKLVEFVNVVESGSNWDKRVWDPAGLGTGATGIEIGELQKFRSEAKTNSQTPGSRSSIAFAPSSHQSHQQSNSSSRTDEPRNGKKSRWDSESSSKRDDSRSDRRDGREGGRENGREKRSRSKSPKRR